MTGQKHIFSLETLFRMTHDLHKAGKTIGITHGAFDLFHISHLDLLKKSAQLCDFLIVGVDSNVNVATYKTYKRPIVDESDRLNIVSELNCVDAVFLNKTQLNAESYTQVYKELHISDVMIGQYFGFRDVINEQVAHAGARLNIIKTKQLPSTTQIIRRIISTYKLG